MDITDEDRRAAADWCASQPFPSKQAEAPSIAAGDYDHHSLVQAFAAHRLASERRAYEKAAERVESLPTPWDGDTLESHAHCVEAGAYSNALDDAAAVIRALATSPAPDSGEG